MEFIFKEGHTRECGTCSACCSAPFDFSFVKDAPVVPGAPCPHSTGSGCDIYATRPKNCVLFYCGWVIKDSLLPEWLKPNNSKVIVLTNKTIWNGHPIDFAIPTEAQIPPHTLAWLKKFSMENNRLLIYAEQINNPEGAGRLYQNIAYGPPEFLQAAAGLQIEGKLSW